MTSIWNADLSGSKRRFRLSSTLMTLVVALLITMNGGCIGLVVHTLYALGGNRVPARCGSLKSQKVAVVCLSESSLGSGFESQKIAQHVSALLAQNVEDISLVRQDQIADWIDNNGWDQIDYREIGQAVGAQKVVGIDLSSFSLYDGQTLFRGHAHVSVTVYDMNHGGTVIFSEDMADFAFPESGGHPTTSTTETKFRALFLSVLSQQIAHMFYAYDPAENFGLSATMNGL